MNLEDLFARVEQDLGEVLDELVTVEAKHILETILSADHYITREAVNLWQSLRAHYPLSSLNHACSYISEKK